MGSGIVRFGGSVPTGRRPQGPPESGPLQVIRHNAGAAVDASYMSAVVFASAAELREVMPQSPQTKLASTIASALVKSA